MQHRPSMDGPIPAGTRENAQGDNPRWGCEPGKYPVTTFPKCLGSRTRAEGGDVGQQLGLTRERLRAGGTGKAGNSEDGHKLAFLCLISNLTLCHSARHASRNNIRIRNISVSLHRIINTAGYACQQSPNKKFPELYPVSKQNGSPPSRVYCSRRERRPTMPGPQSDRKAAALTVRGTETHIGWYAPGGDLGNSPAGRRHPIPRKIGE